METVRSQRKDPASERIRRSAPNSGERSAAERFDRGGGCSQHPPPRRTHLVGRRVPQLRAVAARAAARGVQVVPVADLLLAVLRHARREAERRLGRRADLQGVAVLAGVGRELALVRRVRLVAVPEPESRGGAQMSTGGRSASGATPLAMVHSGSAGPEPAKPRSGSGKTATPRLSEPGMGAPRPEPAAAGTSRPRRKLLTLTSPLWCATGRRSGL